MKNATDLRQLLNTIHRKSYSAYKSTKGSYQFGDYTLSIDHVQGDPFAAPSKISVQIEGSKAGFPSHVYEASYQRIALQDYLIRLFYQRIEKFNFKAKGSGKSGLLSISQCGQEVLERTACTIDAVSGDLLIGLEVGFPANGRTINADGLIKILFDFLPECVNSTFFYRNLDSKKIDSVIFLAEDQYYIREQLPKMELTAFVANGSILPRETGVSSKPMKGAIPFVSPKSFEVSLQLPHRKTITGMGIPRGVTLIVGGGYHGKSTLLKALELGVYNHIEGDGREYVITDDTAVKIRAEDGRSIKKTDISMFINNLPNKTDTTAFYTQDASGSTSQAANVVEGIESKTSLFLIDEDTSATNFMIRDELMQRVVHRNQEPITPFIERVKDIYTTFGISSIIVAGSSGSYFHMADVILQMDHYIPKDITDFAKKEAKAFPMNTVSLPELKSPSFARVAKPNPALKGDRRLKMKTFGKDTIQINKEAVDLHYVEQLIDIEQTTALSHMLRFAETNLLDGKRELQTIIDELLQRIQKKGLSSISHYNYLSSNLAMPRKQEIFACFNRYRGLNL